MKGEKGRRSLCNPGTLYESTPKLVKKDDVVIKSRGTVLRRVGPKEYLRTGGTKKCGDDVQSMREVHFALIRKAADERRKHLRMAERCGLIGAALASWLTPAEPEKVAA